MGRRATNFNSLVTVFKHASPVLVINWETAWGPVCPQAQLHRHEGRFSEGGKLFSSL